MSATHDNATAPVVLFDLDGTLVDSLGDLHAAADRVAQVLGRAPVPIDVVRPAVSRGGRGMLAAAFPDLPEIEREALLDTFLAFYSESIAAHTRLFDGMDAVLARIETTSRWGVVTNKAEGLAHKLLDAISLLPRCALLIGGDTLPRRKPDPLQLVVACERLGVAPGEAIYLGDDRRDVDAASAAGLRSIAVRWGYRDADDDIDTWGADTVLDAPRDLLAAGAMRAR